MSSPGSPEPEAAADPARAARDTARAVLRAARSASPELFSFEGIDLGPAAEQALFGRLRREAVTRRDGHPARARVRSLARVLWHGAASLVRHQRPRAGDVVVVVLQPAQARILGAVTNELSVRGLAPFLLFESHHRGAARGRRRAARLIDQLRPGQVPALLRYEARLARGLGAATRSAAVATDAMTAGRAERTLAESMGRIALYAACLDAVGERRPALMATFNEIGRWARLLPEAARRHDVPSLDIAHAEAADAVAIQGIAYDRFAVFGPAAASVLREAGVDASRIAEVGAPRFDALVARHPVPPSHPPSTRRIVFASQWLTGRMSPDVKRRTIQAVLAAAGAVAPAELVVRLHPIERDDLVAQTLAGGTPPGVVARIEREGDLYDTLDGAWLMATGWSNTVFEAALSNVPALAINATGGEPPTSFAQEQLALGATDERSAAAAASSLRDPDAWLSALAQARAALSHHLGPLDGRATQRLADLVVELVGR